MKKLLLIVFDLLIILCVTSFAVTFDVTNVADFQKALTTAQSNGEDDIINVAAGTYNVSATLTYISDNGDNGHKLTIIGAGSSSVIDGGNNVTMLSIYTDTGNDGGDSGGDVEIRNLLFQNGRGADDGGALNIHTRDANALISDNTFQNNTSTEDGGGFYFYSLNGSIIVNNNRINDNIAGENGGGFRIRTQYGTADVTRNYVYNNIGDGGGGINVYAPYNTITISDNYFRANISYNGFSGGAVQTFSNEDSYGHSGTVNLINNTFNANRAGWYGGGAYLSLARSGSVANIYNNIFWENIANRGNNDGDDLVVACLFGYTPTVNLYNNDFSGNADFATAQSEDLVITNTTNYNHGANQQIDPQFRNSSAGDLHLRSTSPVIDEGLNTAPSIPATDLDGNNRIINGNVDMGAYEYLEATNTNAPANVPTMNEWGIIIFTLLSGISAVFILRKKHI